jgi:hypothetical protein
LNDLATLSAAQKGVSRLGNSSGSATHIRNAAEVSALGSTATAAFIHPATLLGTVPAIALSYLNGKVLAQPGVARALVAIARSGKVKAGMRLLNEAARRAPAGVSPMIQGLAHTLQNPDEAPLDTGPAQAPAPSPGPTGPSAADPNAYDINAYDPPIPQAAPVPDPNDPYAVQQ